MPGVVPVPAVAVTAAEAADSLPAASKALTVKLWLLPWSSPRTVALVPVTVATTSLPSRRW